MGVNDLDFLEAYITFGATADGHAPALTPRIFGLAAGDRIACASCIGHYTLDNVARDANVIFVATGTGEAPHNAMWLNF